MRAAVFAAVCAALAACAHAWMSPDPLPTWAPAVGFGAVFVAAFAGAGRQRSLASITALLAVAQVALHTLFTWASAVAAPALPGPTGSGSLLDRLLCGPRDSDGHILLPSGWSPEEIVRNARVDPALLPGPDASAGQHHMHGSGPMLFDGGTGMLLAHVVAALLTGWWLRRGEAALFTVLALAAAPLRVVFAVLCALVVPAVEAADGARRTGAEPDVATHQTYLRHAVTRRGPPTEYALAC
ncbi:hypothetical protein [Streptomyces sp. SID3343]|uniref:hypothetical protein n=1 Tax=Streptomyces sp. SID3343 TaxID=2690260 RepID=UPI00136DB0D6|nr:hypothetical protein [Streptomyces sp. SID3343]